MCSSFTIGQVNAFQRWESLCHHRLCQKLNTTSPCLILADIDLMDSSPRSWEEFAEIAQPSAEKSETTSDPG